MSVRIDVVIPTVGRSSLDVLLCTLAGQADALSGEIVLVDDRSDPSRPLASETMSAPLIPTLLRGRARVVRGAAAGPAAARNVGWRSCRGEWVVFLDDDVVPAPDWAANLRRDVAGATPDVAGVQGRIRVPRPTHRRPTDWERNVAGLEQARWATADMAYRRADLLAAGGFDERFPRAYREDADLGLRLVRAGRTILRGRRRVIHPVRPADWRVSLRLQAGNADDVLMRALHGPRWREDAGAPAGRRPRHAAAAAAGTAALAALAARFRPLAVAAGLAWLAGTAELAWARIAPGPRTPREIARMVGTSAAMPFLATGWWLAGLARLRRLLADAERAPDAEAERPEAVLLDRDGTLVVDVPYNGDPERVEPMPGARDALDRLRCAGVRLGVISNQSGVGRGLLAESDVAAVNARVVELLGPLGPICVCPHTPDAGCACRKPAPGLVLEAARRLGVHPERCVVIGDIGADVEAARAAGAAAVLVPTTRTRREEVWAAPAVAADLGAAVDLLLGPVPAREATP